MRAVGVVLGCLMFASLPGSGSAVEREWIGGDGVWNEAARWTPEGIPGEGDDVLIGSDVVPGPVVSYASETSPSLGLVQVYAPGTGATLSIAQDTLLAESLRLGQTSRPDAARVAQSGGRLDVGTLIVGYGFGARGTYELTGGEVVAGNIRVTNGDGPPGTTPADGTFQQLGGSVVVDALDVNELGGSYTLVDGPLTSGYTQALHIFLQLGGEHRADRLRVGLGTRYGGTYWLQSGLLEVDEEAVDVLSAFLQFGGTHEVAVDLENDGRFDLEGGTLTAPIVLNEGVFTLDGGMLDAGELAGPGTVRLLSGEAVLGGLAIDGQLELADAVVQVDDVAVGEDGWVTATSGAVLEVSGSFVAESEAFLQWDTRDAQLAFVGAGGHTFQGPGVDRGDHRGAARFNFGWGTLSLEKGGSLILEGGGAVYVGVLALGGGLAQLDAIVGNGSKIYYDAALPENAYLGGALHPLAMGGAVAPITADDPPADIDLLLPRAQERSFQETAYVWDVPDDVLRYEATDFGPFVVEGGHESEIGPSSLTGRLHAEGDWDGEALSWEQTSRYWVQFELPAPVNYQLVAELASRDPIISPLAQASLSLAVLDEETLRYETFHLGVAEDNCDHSMDYAGLLPAGDYRLLARAEAETFDDFEGGLAAGEASVEFMFSVEPIPAPALPPMQCAALLGLALLRKWKGIGRGGFRRSAGWRS